MSAVLLPFTSSGAVDWSGFERHVARTAQCGLVPAVNMDTGYVNLLGAEDRLAVLRRTRDVLGANAFLAGAFVVDVPRDALNLDAYRRAIDQIVEYGGTPVIIQSHGLSHGTAAEILSAYEQIGETCEKFIAFELGTQFAPWGRIYDLATYERLIQIPACMGAKHSSLRRMEEWARLAVRDRVRPDFRVLTGNDLAIDLVMYGSDYLLGLSTMGPDWFARRDALWGAGDARFFELNDLLQYLGCFTFRPPIPAYRHSAAQLLKLRGWIDSDSPHPAAPRRPDSDLAILSELAARIDSYVAALS